MRIAAAPISWGVCEVPGWGHQLAPERVLREMAGLGLTATELGPEGYLDADLLKEYGLTAAGGFVPVVLHDPGHDPVPGLREAVEAFPAGAVVVLAAATGTDGYDARPDLDATGWKTLLHNLDRAVDAIDGLVTLHPHVGTMIEARAEVERVLDGSAVPLCLDTGHLLIGGTDPAALAASASGRIAHVHLKDVDAAMAGRVGRGELTYTDAVRQGVYRPLGRGEVDVAGIVRTLTDAGYEGWYVMEQDVILTGAPASDEGPVADVRAGISYLEAL